MMWDNVDYWGNKPLANYVKEKQREWLHIPSGEEMKELLAELGKGINLSESGQVAMLMYLTGMDWSYRLSSMGWNSRFMLCFNCSDWRNFRCIPVDECLAAASLCMIACE